MKKNILNKKITSFILTSAFIISSITVPSSVSYSAVRTKSITLNTSNLVLQEGEKAEIKVTKVKPKKARKKVTYKSNKKSVATVTKKGVVTAKKEGTAKITVTSKANKKVKRTVKVTVLKKTGNNIQNKPDVSIQTPVPDKKPAQTPSAKPTQSPVTKPDQTDESSYQQKVLELVNKERKAQGLNEMVLDDSLCSAAGIRANEIITLFSHTRPDGTSCFSVLKELGISYRATGENIASGYRTPEQVMDGWMNSEGHRANILSSNFNKLGVGYIKTGSGTYWVQLFTD